MDRHNREEEEFSTEKLLVQVCSWSAIILGALGFIRSSVAYAASMGVALGLQSSNPGLNMVDLWGAQEVTTATHIYLFVQTLANALIIIGALWLQRNEDRGRRFLRSMQGFDVLMFLGTLVAWKLLDVHPPMELVMLNLSIALGHIMILVALAHPMARQALQPPAGPQPEKEL